MDHATAAVLREAHHVAARHEPANRQQAHEGARMGAMALQVRHRTVTNAAHPVVLAAQNRVRSQNLLQYLAGSAGAAGPVSARRRQDASVRPVVAALAQPADAAAPSARQVLH